MKEQYYIGLDLGKRQDFSAVSVLYRKMQPAGLLQKSGSRITRTAEELDEYQIQHLHRFDAGTPYREVARYMQRLQGASKLRKGRCKCIVDKTGVGEPVFEMLREEGVRNLYGVTITGGQSPSGKGRDLRVPKRDLASTLQVLVQNGDLVHNEELPFAELLAEEMQNFRVKINPQTGHDSYEHWRSGDHDDLVLAVALPAWFAEYKARGIDWSKIQPTYVSVN